jgi:hypothetical protein
MPRRNKTRLFVKFERAPCCNKARSYGETILDNENKVAVTRSRAPASRSSTTSTTSSSRSPATRTACRTGRRPSAAGDQHINDPEVWRGPCRAPPDMRAAASRRVRRPPLPGRVGALQGRADRADRADAAAELAGIDPASVDELAYFSRSTPSSSSRAQRLERGEVLLILEPKKAIGEQFRAEMEAKDKQLKEMQERSTQLALEAKAEKVTPKEAEAMNAVFKLGTVRVVENGRDVEKDVELVTLSGGYLGKDEVVTRPRPTTTASSTRPSTRRSRTRPRKRRPSSAWPTTRSRT